ATIPSQRLKPGDVVSVKDRSQKMPIFSDFRVGGSSVPYVEADANSLNARLVSLPERSEVPIICAEHLVVEYYSR
ncbi:MAG: 30S ribosomal protein S4, partial [Thermomicrobiales bacterium]